MNGGTTVAETKKKGRQLLAGMGPIRVYQDGKLYDIVNEVTGQALTVDFANLKILQQVLDEEFGAAEL
jgi:hypothetical protein